MGKTLRTNVDELKVQLQRERVQSENRERNIEEDMMKWCDTVISNERAENEALMLEI